jgi:uncharacterized protein (UPF0276 family)
LSKFQFGLGLRPTHYDTILAEKPDIDFFEAITEDYIDLCGEDFRYLEKIREYYPVSLHGVALSMGGCDPINRDYLRDLKKLIALVEPITVSDHFCWTGVDGINMHDLLPLPFTQEAISHLVSRIQFVQEYLQRPIMLENVSTYIAFDFSEMTEWAFISEICKQSGCAILLDINNIYVNAFNHHFSAQAYLQNIPAHYVKQFHLAGHKHCQTHIIDTHDAAVCDDVWDLYRVATQLFPNTPLVIERDADIPSLDDLLMELGRARGMVSG